MSKVEVLKSTIIAIILFASVSAFAQERIVSFSEVPDSIQAYVKKHFPDNKVLQAEVDFKGLTKEYDIILSDNIKLEFNKKNNIKSIDAKTELPGSVIPKAILNYVKSNYPDNFITEWELEDKHQEIGLDNGLELEFKMNGEFIRIDN